MSRRKRWFFGRGEAGISGLAIIGVGVRVPGGKLTPQAVRLLAGLAEDAAFAVRVFAGPEAEGEALSPVVRAVLAVECWLVPVPERVALPVLAGIVIEPESAAPGAGLAVMVDLAGGPVDRTLAGEVWRVQASPVRAVLAGATFTEAVLVAGGRVLARAVYDAKPLATHNAAYVSEKSAQMVLRELKRGAAGSAQPAAAEVGPGSALGYVLRTAGKALARVRKRIAARRGRFVQGFSLRLGQGTAAEFDPVALRPVDMPPHSLWADPFLIAHDGAVHCFFEDVDPAVGHGHISVGRVSAAGITDVRVAMKQPRHMSYPFVFHHEGELLMMPEVHAAGRLEIWRCTGFPGDWVLHATALEGTPVCDSVLFKRDGEWWLFTHISNDRFGDFCSDLHVFRVDGPGLTGLVPHRLNPVVTDARVARGGGRIHRVDGRMLRFSQDNTTGSYGGALNVMEITRLDLDHYEELRVRHITPGFAPGLMGCHHFDAVDGWVVMDVRGA